MPMLFLNLNVYSRGIDGLFIRVETKPVVSDGASVLVSQVKPQIAGVALLVVVKCVLWDQYSANTTQ